MKTVLALAVMAVPLAFARAEDTPRQVDDLVSEFTRDPLGAKEKYTKQSVKLEVEIANRYTESNKVYHHLKATGLPKTARILLKLPKLYRPTDQLIVTATLKLSTWDKDEKKLYFDPVAVDKEIKVLPELWKSTDLLLAYNKSQRKMSEMYEGKEIDISGLVNFVANGGVVLDYVASTDSQGRVRKDGRGFDFLGRALVTVRFADDSISKANLKRGSVIEARGIVEMKGGVIVLTKATLTK